MSSTHDRSVTPSRRYGDIIGSIFSNGSTAELEINTDSPGSEAKRKFRERRQTSPGGCLSRSSTPERRQDSSPGQKYNDSGRPPTPERRTQPRSPRLSFAMDAEKSPKARGNKLSSAQLDPFQKKLKGISIRALSKSPSRRKASSEINFSGPTLPGVTTHPSESIAEKKQEAGIRNVTVAKNELTHQGAKGKATEVSGRSKFSSSIPTRKPLSKTDEEKTKSAVSFFPNDDVQMKKIVQAQNEQIHFYENRLKERSNDVEQLRFELQKSKRIETKLELELDIHDLKYSMYDDYRRSVDRHRLDGKSAEEVDDTEEDFSNSHFTKTCDTFLKLNRLDELYEKSKAEAADRYALLKHEHDGAMAKISKLEAEKITQSVVVGTDHTVTLSFLEKRITILEAENLRHLHDLKLKQEELDAAKSKRKTSAAENEEALETHTLEKQALMQKILALETEIGFTSGNVDNRTRTRRYRALEKNLNEYVVEIMGLEDQLKAKEKIISRLKEREFARDFGSLIDASSENRSSAKWYEQSNKGRKAGTLSSKSGTGASLSSDELHGLEYISATNTNANHVTKEEGEKKVETPKIASGDNIEAVSTHINAKIGEYNFGSRKSSRSRRKGSSTSSARIAMLRKRLDAIANDHSSICTEETHFSSRSY